MDTTNVAAVCRIVCDDCRRKRHNGAAFSYLGVHDESLGWYVLDASRQTVIHPPGTDTNPEHVRLSCWNSGCGRVAEFQVRRLMSKVMKQPGGVVVF